jgi:hypothetical protein
MEKSIVVPEKPGYLQTVTSTGEEFRAGLPGGINLPFLSIRGKEFRVRKGDQEAPLARELEVVFIAARQTISKRYYKDKYTGVGAGTVPTCMSTDGVTPDVPNPISESCSTCPMNVWGSRVTDAGKLAKECQDYKRLIIGLLGENIYPLVFDVPATSLKAPKGQIGKDMMLKSYLDILAQHQIPPFAVVTRLTFTGAEYPQVAFEFVRYLSEEEYEKVRKLREGNEDIKETLAGGETPAQVSESSLPAEAASNSAEELLSPVEETSSPVEEPSPQVVPLNDGDLLAEVKKLLEN